MRRLSPTRLSISSRGCREAVSCPPQVRGRCGALHPAPSAQSCRIEKCRAPAHNRLFGYRESLNSCGSHLLPFVFVSFFYSVGDKDLGAGAFSYSSVSWIRKPSAESESSLLHLDWSRRSGLGLGLDFGLGVSLTLPRFIPPPGSKSSPSLPLFAPRKGCVERDQEKKASLGEPCHSRSK